MRKPSIEAIAYAVARRYGLTLGQFKGSRRHRSIAHPRQLAMYLCRALTDASYPRIGDLFGRRDHSTVINACKAVRRRVEQDPNGPEAARITEFALLLVPHVEHIEQRRDPFVAAFVAAGIRTADTTSGSTQIEHRPGQAVECPAASEQPRQAGAGGAPGHPRPAIIGGRS